MLQSLFDKRGTKSIPKTSVGELLRALGQNPTQAEVADIEDTLPAEVDLGTFVGVLNRPDGYRSAGTAGKVFHLLDSLQPVLTLLLLRRIHPRIQVSAM